MKIGLIKEGKTPPDTRVPLTPEQCILIQHAHPVEIVVEPYDNRCFQDDEYRKAGVSVSNDLSDCDFLLGVKEVPLALLIPYKTYFFFSHTIKKQPFNRMLLWTILEKQIRLIDYEVLKDDHGKRIIAFGKFAGMVGAHNALWTYGKRTGKFSLPRMYSFAEYAQAREFYKKVDFSPVKIVLTGSGRVSTGSAKVLSDMGIERVSPDDFLTRQFDHPVFTQLSPKEYVRRKDGANYSRADFYAHPDKYESIFAPYQRVSDIMINGIFWDSRAPVFFTKEDMAKPDFRIEVIADVTCDIAPESSVPSTIRPSTIASPVYGYDPVTGAEADPFTPGHIDVMAIDNLPSELPRDASRAFGEQFIKHVLPELLKEHSLMLEKATIAENGVLGKHFRYLEDYVNGTSDSLVA